MTSVNPFEQEDDGSYKPLYSGEVRLDSFIQNATLLTEKLNPTALGTVTALKIEYNLHTGAICVRLGNVVKLIKADSKGYFCFRSSIPKVCVPDTVNTLNTITYVNGSGVLSVYNPIELTQISDLYGINLDCIMQYTPASAEVDASIRVSVAIDGEIIYETGGDVVEIIRGLQDKWEVHFVFIQLDPL